MPANFRSEEGMRRLLTAVIAAHDIKLNYKDIAKFFGDSTPDGIQWQFRQIKRDAEAMKQGKGAPDSTPSATPSATPTKASSTPAAKASGRKRAVPPSTGRSTAKKAKGTHVKLESQVINLDDDDSEHSPIQTPTKTRRLNIDFDQEREDYARRGVDYDTGAPLAMGAPALSLAQSDSPNNDEDVKPTTPGDTTSYSFVQTSQQHNGADGWDTWNNGSFGAGNSRFSNSLGNHKSYVADDLDDDLSV